MQNNLNNVEFIVLYTSQINYKKYFDQKLQFLRMKTNLNNAKRS